MELKRLKDVLQNVADLFTTSGAAAQAKELKRVTDLLNDAPDRTSDAFVTETMKALDDAARDGSLAEQPASAIVERLRSLDDDKAAFDRIVQVLKAKTVQKELVTEVAGLYTGAGPTAFKTKPKAVKAIEEKHRERAFMASKSRLNERVTPW